MKRSEITRRSVKRIPGLKIALTTIIVAFMFFGSQNFLRGDGETSEEKKSERIGFSASIFPPSGGWIWWRSGEDGRPISLETPVVRFVEKDVKNRIEIDLVGAIHFADTDYYRELNRLLSDYDTVLVELVLPPGGSLESVSKNKRGASPKSTRFLDWFQRSSLELSEWLGLVYQLDEIDYRAENFVWADLNSEELAAAFRDGLREVEWFGGTFASADEPDFLESDFLAALFVPNRRFAFRRLLAREMARGLSETFETESAERTTIPFEEAIIQRRNDAALAVLRDRIATGDRKIAIFYGVAHLPDFATKLEADFGLREENRRWLPAWNLTDKAGKRNKGEK